ncbi:MAG TPA: hypothetical protein VN256_08175 [Pyrinomonadaceae bacterium]|nr:hypothetical protein [Pyrinomonadaceae bacterium]
MKRLFPLIILIIALASAAAAQQPEKKALKIGDPAGITAQCFGDCNGSGAGLTGIVGVSGGAAGTGSLTLPADAFIGNGAKEVSILRPSPSCTPAALLDTLRRAARFLPREADPLPDDIMRPAILLPDITVNQAMTRGDQLRAQAAQADADDEDARLIRETLAVCREDR